MSRYNINLLFLYLLNISFVVISYFLHQKFQQTHKYSEFEYFLIFQVLYFLWWKFSNFELKNKWHLLFIGFLFLGSEPLFENDHYRYFWEGKVIAGGYNPYKLAPNSKKLNHIEFSKRTQISYNKLTTIYPPLAQVFFTLLSPLKYKTALMLMQSIGLLMLIYIVFNLFPSNKKYLLLIYPYLCKEFVQAVHIDILACLILLIFLNKNKVFTGIYLSFLTKIISILALPFYFFKGVLTNRKLLMKTLVCSSLVLVTLLLYPTDLSYHSGASAFVKFWSWNSLISIILVNQKFSQNEIRIISLLLFSASYAYLLFLFYKSNRDQVKKYISVSYMFLFLFAPVLHPWYLIWPMIWAIPNKWYFYFLFSSFLAYYPYGSSVLEVYAECIQFCLLGIAIYKELKTLSIKCID